MDILRNRIWHELYSAKYNSLFMGELIRNHRSRVRYFDIFIAVAAGAGTLLSQVIEIAPLIASITVSLAALIKALRPSILMAENQLASRVKTEEFQVWILAVNLEALMAALHYKDGNGRVLC